MEFELEYNSERPLMIIPEYGRHIQKLVDHCVALETKDERNTMAKAIVDVMGNLQPHLRDVPDFKHKLWDQLFIMSGFDLDADSPFERPSKEELQEKPEALPYPKSASRYRYYGNNIQTMIDVALTWEAGEKREALERAELEKQRAIQKEREEQERKEAQRIAAEQRLAEIERKRQANKEHRRKINNVILSQLVALGGVSEDQAKSIISEMVKGNITNVSTNY